MSDTEKKIGKYQIVKKIGTGSFGKVYLAVDERLHKRWAIKSVPLSVPDGEREGFLLNKLHHPGIPAIWDVFREDENWYLVMEYVEGQTLGELLRESGRMQTGQVLEWGIELCGILKYLHGKKPAVVHLDLKPENIMLNQEGRLVLIDFGAAREMLPQKPESWMCTRKYQAPEQRRGEFSEKSDLYMLGGVMKALWNGRRGSRLRRIIRRCLRTNPKKRYADTEALEKALREAKKNQKEKRRLLPEIVAGAGILLVAFWISAIEMTEKKAQKAVTVQENLRLVPPDKVRLHAAELYEEGILQNDKELLRAGVHLYIQEQSLEGRENYGQQLRIALGFRILGEGREAAAWYEHAIELSPKSPEAYAAYGWQLVLDGAPDRAWELLERGRISGMLQDDNVQKLMEELKRRGFE